MKTSPQLELIIENIRDLCRGQDDEPETLAALLWLLVDSEDCRRVLEAASPTGEDLERLCARLGQPARAWVQFSPRACELLNRPVLPSRLRHPATLSRRASSHVHTASGRRPRPRVLQLR